MVGDKSIERDIGHVGVGFQFGENVFLRTAAVVKFDDLSGAGCFISEDDLVGKAELQRNKEVKLDGFLGLYRFFSAHEKEPTCMVPGFGFPGFFEESDIEAAGGPNSGVIRSCV